MNNDALIKAIEEDCVKREYYDDYIVRVRYKYSFEEKWTYSNEYLEYDGPAGWCWIYDWYEGQQDVEFLGFMAIEDIDIPPRKEK